MTLKLVVAEDLLHIYGDAMNLPSVGAFTILGFILTSQNLNLDENIAVFD
jgi:hypothetical protein